MKYYFILGLAGVLFTSCQQNTAKEADQTSSTEVVTTIVASADAPVMVFEQESYDFGKIKQGESIQYAFKFKNTGKTPLIISNATATCGCTVPEPPKDPILPGAEAVINVVFNSAGKIGVQDKVITITSNGNPTTNEVHLLGEVTQP